MVDCMMIVAHNVSIHI